MFILVLSPELLAQQLNKDDNTPSRTLPFDSIAPKIELKYKVSLFYRLEWFDGKVFRESVTGLPLKTCIDVIKRTANLDCIVLNSTDHIFVPIETKNYSNRVNNKGVLLIGEPSRLDSNVNVRISGKIFDLKSGKPLDGARITIEKLNLNTISDRNGNYKIIVPSGDYDVKINYVGYEEDIRKIKVYGDGIVNFEVSEKIIKLKEITVVDRYNLSLQKTQMSAVSLNAKAIKELPGFLGQKDVIKSVVLLPGIQSTGEFGTGFFVRGGNSDQNLILIEGVPIFNSSHLFGLISSVNSDAISSVTLLKAGIPAKYGERASSVMDIELKNNTEKMSGKGGIGLMDSRLNMEIPLFNKRVNVFIGGRTSYSNWLLHAMPDADLKNSSANFLDVNALVKIKLTPKDNLSVFGYVSNDKFSFIKGSPYQYNNLLASVKYSHVFTDKFYLNFISGISNYTNNITSSDTLKPKEAFKIRSFINYKNMKANFTWLLNKNNIVEFGLNGVHYKLQQGSLTPHGDLSEINYKSLPLQRSIELSTYLTDNISFTPDLSTEIGLRLSKYMLLGPGRTLVFQPNVARTISNIADTTFYNNNQLMNSYLSFEPRLSIRYSLDKSSSLKLSYNRNTQHINLVSNTAVMSPTDVYNLTSNNIKPLINNQIAVGYLKNFNNNSIETSIETYFKKTDNIVEYRNGASILMNDLLEADLLNASGYSFGLELYIKKNTGKLTGWMSYTYSRAMRRTTSPYAEDQINRNNYYSSPFDIPHNLIINANYHLTRRWRLSGVFYFNSGKPVTLPELKYTFNGRQYIYYSDRNKYRIDDYHRLDIAITFDESLRFKQKWKGSWTLSIINLYGNQNPYSVFYKSNSQLKSNFYQKFNLYQLFIIDRPIPTFTYNFSF